MNVLVTGGAGFIGSHACKALARAGYTPITFDNLSRGHQWAVKWGPFVFGDIRDTPQVRSALETYRPIGVLHFAALAYVGESVQEPLRYYENNVGGTASLLKAIIEVGKLPFVFSSTCATYGAPDKLPISEDNPQRPINPYGRSKLFVEMMLKDLQAAEGIQWASLRYFNAAGADPDGEIGESHEPETHLIPLAIGAASGGPPLQIFGEDYDTPDGTCVRDYVHVSDLADAHVLALRYLLDGGSSCALNLANSRGYSVKEVISAVERVSGRSVEVIHAPRRQGDPAVLIGDARRARSVLSWQPARSALEDQVRHAWSWARKKLG